MVDIFIEWTSIKPNAKSKLIYYTGNSVFKYFEYFNVIPEHNHRLSFIQVHKLSFLKCTVSVKSWLQALQRVYNLHQKVSPDHMSNGYVTSAKLCGISSVDS